MRTVGALALVFAMLAATGEAQNGRDPTPVDQALGERLHVQAVEALSENRLVEAERLIRESLEAHTWSRPVFTHAEIFEALGRPLDAIEVYEALAANRYGEVAGPAREAVVNALARAGRQVAHLEISWNDIDSPILVRIDGAEIGTTRERALRVDVNPGERLVRAEAPDREAIERRVRVEPGSTAAVAIAWPAAASVGRVIVRVADATISLAGQQADDELVVSLEPGEYEVVVSGEHGRRRETVEVSAGQTSRYEFSTPRRRNRAWVWVLAGVVVLGAAAATTAILVGRDEVPQLPVDDLGT